MECPFCAHKNPDQVGTCQICGSPLRPGTPPLTVHALPGGTKLRGGHFTVGKVLGQGGFGITYLGSDTRLQCPVAIKEFFPQGDAARAHQSNAVVPAGRMPIADYESTKAKFLDEAYVLAQFAQFNHPGIVRVYFSFEENNTAYMVMEYLKGKTLLGVLAERSPLPEGEAVDYIARVGDALAVVHQANFLHRDIKPENVIRTDDGRVVLVDFGTARKFAAGKTKRMTAMLTPGYAPLEAYGQQARFGPFTDIYALGATLYHLLTGQVPVPATDRATGVRLPAPRDATPQVSAAVSDAVMWAMETVAQKRPQAVQAFLGVLRGPATPKRPAATGSAPQHSVEFKKKMLAIGAAAGVALLSLVWLVSDFASDQTKGARVKDSLIVTDFYLKRRDCPAARSELQKARDLAPKDRSVLARVTETERVCETPKKPPEGLRISGSKS